MYYYDSNGQVLHPTQTGEYQNRSQNFRAPLLPQGYKYNNSKMMYGDAMDTLKGWLTSPWMIITVILIIMSLVLLMNSKEGYRRY